MLELVGLEGRRAHLPAELSGGEQQRVAIARAIVADPALVLADEPTGDLDSDAARAVMEVMVELNRRTGTTFVVATHNPEFALLASQVHDLRDGRIVPRVGD